MKIKCRHRSSDPLGRGSYDIPARSVAGSSCTGEDGPASRHRVKPEVDRLRDYLEEHGIKCGYDSTLTSNVFCRKVWIVVNAAKDYEEAKALADAWLAEHERDTTHIHHANA